MNRAKLPPRWLRDFLPLLAWLAVIFFLSSRSVLVNIDNEAGEKLFYKTAHMLAFALLAWLWWRAITPRRTAGWPVFVAALGLTVLYGISDEIHQYFVPGRHARLADVLFDTGGALAMILLLRKFEWLRHFPEKFVFQPQLC